MRKDKYKNKYRITGINRTCSRSGRQQEFRQRIHCVARVSVLTACIIFMCGCTRREQLLLDVNGTAQSSEGLAEQSDEVSEGSIQAQEAYQGAAGIESEAAFGQTTRQTESVPEQQEAQGQMPPENEARTICVHVCGAVRNPAVYELPAGSRVYEAVEKAGGFAEDADESYVNQAQTLTDGVKLVIPTLQQTSEMAAPEGSTVTVGIVGAEAGAGTPDGGVSVQSAAAGTDVSASDGRININTASETELCSIPGIGATRAAAIVAYRQEHGAFSSVEEIMNVSGIKEGTYAKIKDSIKVN